MHAQGSEHAEGRMIAISTLKVLLGKLPEKLMTQWAPLFYMPLVLGLVNDEDAACRQLLAAAASDLLKVTAATPLHSCSTHACVATRDHTAWQTACVPSSR